ncbi:hypothetical protein G6F57_003710 [Rhizopus arrhizus]|uniref:Uncharacterized protein n=1 Tax=Rhizopus oryzae TaxID=64495 RepID=A0A9P7BMR5_RHIOR|nr:hypothetical protein G6F23_002049 [Rhizopus arrhizus]KAG1422954.1 hypothetical protein G6F58_003039 [Rhizopus delemar]KAG0767509.1 hypothetical protein G6F24_002720 [Rhizopus arrhizus]KAG0791283.1 hypothetical protein G6F21_005197 [Rhizopus arrhizus]KAG0801176.1 hypothetical protein G6F22_001507 [Rhizopus arrhizus]
MRSLLILATLALVCFVDKNSAAAVRRDFSTPSTDSSITTAGSSTNAQTNPGTIAVAVTPKTGIENSGPALEENNKGNAPNAVTAAPAPEPTVTPEPTDAPKTAPPASAPPASSAPSPNAPAPNAPSVAATATADVHSGN